MRIRSRLCLTAGERSAHAPVRNPFLLFRCVILPTIRCSILYSTGMESKRSWSERVNQYEEDEHALPPMQCPNCLAYTYLEEFSAEQRQRTFHSIPKSRAEPS